MMGPRRFRRPGLDGELIVSHMGTARLSEEDYTAMFDRIARLDSGLDFLREHARRAGEVGQTQLATALSDMRRLYDEQAMLLTSASRADVLRRELLEMAATIEQARREVAALQPKNADSNRLMIATHELDAIVSTTERASFDILQSAERLMELLARARCIGTDPELCAAMEAEVTEIFTACSFQDLTGQRTGKVVGALRYVEQRVAAMMNLWAAESGSVVPVQAEPGDSRPDAHLLNGPSSNGIGQDDVDALMNGAALAKQDGKSRNAGGATPVPLDQSAIDNLFE